MTIEFPYLFLVDDLIDHQIIIGQDHARWCDAMTDSWACDCGADAKADAYLDLIEEVERRVYF